MKKGMETEAYRLWIDWQEKIVSFHEVAGFEQLPFATHEAQQANAVILLAAGFRFQ